ncbi:MAG TPA: hypothetical protein DCR93_39740 [Cytophagales bacterium]|nr:hypothetical protein [Cytophagales bacterium]HAP65359.1 hypothetical protein [Cytophagales bacterium]
MVRALPVFLFSFLLSITCLQAQTSSEPLVNQYLEQAKNLMYEGKYQDANVVFRKMLALNTTLPEDMSYLFAETLYHLGQHKNSQNFLTKYLTLTGRAGSYYEPALELQELLDVAMRAVTNCRFCNGAGFRLVDCTTCNQEGTLDKTCPNCQGHGRTQCQKCYGEGVLVSLNKLGTRQYATCDNCDGKGIHTCRVCVGTKVISSPCPTCLGSLKMRSSILCNHLPLEAVDHNHNHNQEGENGGN